MPIHFVECAKYHHHFQTWTKSGYDHRTICNACKIKTVKEIEMTLCSNFGSYYKP